MASLAWRKGFLSITYIRVEKERAAEEKHNAHTERDSSTRKTNLVALRIVTIKIYPFAKGEHLRQCLYSNFFEGILDKEVGTGT